MDNLDPSSSLPATSYIDRDLSDLAYVRRILEQAQSPSTPLAERLGFVGISSAVLDEFVAVRLDKVASDARSEVQARITQLRTDQFHTLTEVLETLTRHGVQARAVPFQRTAAVPDALTAKFSTDVLPAVTPLTIDREHPFPFLRSHQLCLVADVRDPDNRRQWVVVPLPPSLGGLTHLPAAVSEQPRAPIRTDLLIANCIEHLLPAYQIADVALFRVIRADDIQMEPDFADLRSEVQKGLRTRDRNPIVCVEINTHAPAELGDFVAAQLFTSIPGFICRCPYPGIAPFAELQSWAEAQLSERVGATAFYPPPAPHKSKALADFQGDWFAAMRHGDILLHWPYDDYGAQVDLLRQAASDPDVIAIKQTLYRTDAAVVDSLLHAARNGKDVTVVLELEARANEAHNVGISRELEQAGVRIIYGLIDLKIHAKALLIVRKEPAGLREYANFATGNYHTGNARQYSDLSLFTAHPGLGRDLTRLFNYITGNLSASATENLVLAPNDMRRHLLRCIAREADNARMGMPAGIWLKLNSLLDRTVIDALYEAAQAGVPIKAVVRRHCALRPGIPELSPGVEVKSLIGRYLEHARVVCFANGASLPSPQAGVYLGSADWMPRNFDDRVEVLVPILDERLRMLLMQDFLGANFRDSQQSWTLHADGSYERQPPGFCAQSHFSETALT